MKKAFTIIAVVAGYCLLETALLFGFITPGLGTRFPNLYDAIVGWGQLLIIPGMAALFSRLTYGSFRWRRRAMIIVAVGALGVPLLLFLILSTTVLLEWAASTSIALSVILSVVIVAVITQGLVVVIKGSSNHNVQIEATRWLAERQSDISSRDRQPRNRAIRLASCIPSLTVLLATLFLPQLWGVVSHISRPRAADLSGYRVPIPATWIVLDSSDEPTNGYSWAAGLAGQGFGLGPIPYLHPHSRLSSWSVTTEQFASNHPRSAFWAPEGDEATGHHDFAIGSESMSCSEYRSYQRRQRGPEDSSKVLVRCSGSGRLYVSMEGDRVHLPAFYRMLEGTTQISK